MSVFKIPVDKITGPVVLGKIDLKIIPPSKIKGKKSHVSKTARAAVYLRDGNCCLKCGKTEDLTIDHIKPLSKGGKNEINNYQTLCKDCNCEKNDCEIDYRKPDTINKLSIKGKQKKRQKEVIANSVEPSIVEPFSDWYKKQPQMNFHEEDIKPMNTLKKNKKDE